MSRNHVVLFAGAAALLVTCGAGSAQTVELSTPSEDAIRAERFTVPQTGALTFDTSFYSFDFARAGLGETTFATRGSRVQWPSALSAAESSYAAADSAAADSKSYTVGMSSFSAPAAVTYSGGLTTGESTPTSVVGLDPVVTTPEPATWLAAAFALGAIGFTQRRRFLRRTAADA